SPDGTRLYVTLAGEGRLVVLDALTGVVLDGVDTHAHPRSVIFSDRGVVVVVHVSAGLLAFDLDGYGIMAGVSHDAEYRVGNPWQHSRWSKYVKHLLDIEFWSHHAGSAVAAATDPERGDVYVAHNQVAPRDPRGPLPCQPNDHARGACAVLWRPAHPRGT
ncbi:MAG: hypothetical protein QF464_21285, partial [Myxococcota bacterium]|nr:hypothetical protein [Myxococcota bacterium]